MPILDKDGKEVKEMPKWHQDVDPRFLMTWRGNWFTFEGIDPNKPEIIFFKWKEPTKSTKRRDKCKS